MVPAVPDLAIKVVTDGIPLEKQNEDRRDFEREMSMKPIWGKNLEYNSKKFLDPEDDIIF